MPVYEYEHLYDESELCDHRFSVVQGVNEPSLDYCPFCGLEVKRVVSQISVVRSVNFDADKAAKRGFTTFRKTAVGEWEKIAGVGTDMIVGTEEDKAAIAEERKAKPVVDLDKPD